MRTPVFTALALATASITAQARESAPRVPLSEAGGEWMIPIHTQAADSDAGAYGYWAAGPNYKASFDDGFTFYPVLGANYPHNQPLRWRTEKITVGEHVAVDGADAATPHVSPWRYELCRDCVIEAYDVRADGVEQTFVLREPLAGSGDVVVHGRFTTNLVPVQGVLSAVEGIGFADAQGKELVRYGKAIAFDAAGRRTDVTTTLEGSGIALRLAGSWLAGATYPVTIDPLTSTQDIGASTESMSYVSIGRDDIHDQVCVAFARASSASDWDLTVRLRNDDLTHVASIFTDVNASFSTRYSSVAFAHGADRWTIAFERDFGTDAGVRVYFHNGANVTLNSGTIHSVLRPIGASDRFPSIGGQSTAADMRAFVVFQRDPSVTNSSTSRVYGATIDASTMTIGSANNLHPNGSITDYDAESPCITQEAGTSGAWMVVWQEYNRHNTGDDWDIIVQKVGRDGTLLGDDVLGHSGTNSRHKLHPIVAGSGGRFLVSYLMRDNVAAFSSSTGNELAVQRFDWTDAAGAPTKLAPQVLASSGSNTLRASIFDRPIAYDTNTRSHWAVGYRDTNDDAFVARLGYQGRKVELAPVFADPVVQAVSQGVCYNNDDYEFVLAYTTDSAPSNSVAGTRLQYFATAQNTVYGPGCLGNIVPRNDGFRDNPYRGSEFFSLEVSAGAVNASTVLYVAPAPAQISIPGICTINLDLATLVQFAAGVSDATGRLRVPFGLPDWLPAADLYWQFFQLDVGGVTATRGLRTEIR